MTAKLMTDDKTFQVFKQMNDYYNKAKSTESHFFLYLSRSEMQSEHENRPSFFIISLALLLGNGHSSQVNWVVGFV